MYSLKSKNSQSGSSFEGGNAKPYSNAKVMNPYAQEKEDCHAREVTKRVVASGEEFLFMGDEMKTKDDVKYALSYIDGSMNRQLNAIASHAGNDKIERVDVKVYETEFEDDAKAIYIKNIIKLMQYKKISFSPNLRINFTFIKLNDTEEMDGEGKLEMDFKYMSCKD